MKKFVTMLCTAVALPISANAATVDFTGSPTGGLAEGSNIGGIVFTSALGSGLQIGNYGAQSNGNGLAAFDDTNGNFIKGAIAGGASFISLAFGNDDPAFSNVGDLATLRLYNGATLVAMVTTLLNRDDVMNQTISYTGAFDNFSFAYTDAAGNPFTGGGNANTGLIEIIDDISFRAGGVPEPAAWAMMLAGFGLVGSAMRRREKVAVTFA